MSWPWMTTPWSLVATLAVVLPIWNRRRADAPNIWFAWCWTVLNLVMFCLWKVAKPNYFLPCLPGAAILTGYGWVSLTRLAHQQVPGAKHARRFLQANWAILFVAAILAPVVVAKVSPKDLTWSVILAAVFACAMVASAWVWRRGANSLAMTPVLTAVAFGVFVGYGFIAPHDNLIRGHRGLAATLDRILPREAETVMFFHELDEGLWFYLRDRHLRPVPGSQPRYNEGYDMLDDYLHNRLVYDPVARMNREKQILIDWIRNAPRDSQYVLIRTKLYDKFAADLSGIATPVHCERGMKRNDLSLLRVNSAAVAGSGGERTRR
jgi:hypothetical protein